MSSVTHAKQKVGHVVSNSPWPVVRVKDIASLIQYGHTASAIARSDGPRFLRITDIQDGRVNWDSVPSCDIPIDEIPRYRLAPGDLVFARTGATTGKSFLIEQCPESVFASYLIRVRVNAEIDPRYLAAFFQSPDYWAQIEKGKRGIGQPNVNGRILGEVRLPLPPLSEQRRIVAEIEEQFTRLDTGIAALRRTQANLKRYRASVLKAACEGRLVPTEAELAKVAAASRRSSENTPSRDGSATFDFETGAMLLGRILANRQAMWAGRGSYKEASPPRQGLPNLPEGWAWSSVEQAGHIQLGRQRAPQHHSGDNMRPYLRVANVFEDRIDTSDVMRMNFTPVEFEKYRLRYGDILLNEGQTPELVGRPAMFRDEVSDCCYQKTLLRFRAYEGVLPTYALTVFRSYMHNGRFTRAASITTNIAHLTAEKFVEIEFPLPPLAEQKRIIAEVERRLSVIDELETSVAANLARATRLRQSILQKAFTVPATIAVSSPAAAVADTPRRPNRHFARALLSAEIVHQLHAEPTFGRIKHQKIFHLCEHIARLTEIDGQYHREAAGPLDHKLIYANEAELKKQKWYAEETDPASHRHSYRPLEKAGAHAKYLEQYWADQLPTIRRLIDLMRTWNTEACEIFSTVYAAWNDLLLWGRPADDEAILDQILGHWHDSKKRIPRERWLNAITWMRQKGFVPTGFGRATATPFSNG